MSRMFVIDIRILYFMHIVCGNMGLSSDQSEEFHSHKKKKENNIFGKCFQLKDEKETPEHCPQYLCCSCLRLLLLLLQLPLKEQDLVLCRAGSLCHQLTRH